jgi:hypothetical protein
MKKLSASRLAAMALAGSLGASALAQQAAPDQVIAFLDKDGDGKCSLNEYLTFQVGRLAQFDADGDGVLQYGEFRDSLQGRARQNAQRSFDAFNIEENRKALTRREFLGYHAYVFKQFVDADGDGFMSAAEWEKIVAAA